MYDPEGKGAPISRILYRQVVGLTYCRLAPLYRDLNKCKVLPAGQAGSENFWKTDVCIGL
jgi:hypothetical protein